MRKDKTGKIIFDDFNEAYKYLDDVYSEENIRARAKVSSKGVRVECPKTRRDLLIKATQVYLSHPKYKKCRNVICFLIDAVDKGIPRNSAISYLAYVSLKVKPQEVLDLEKEAIDTIKNKLMITNLGNVSQFLNLN